MVNHSGRSVIPRMTIVSEYTPGTKRNTELALLLFAIAISLGAYALVDITTSEDQSLSAGFWPYAIVFPAFVIAAHFVLRFYAAYADPVILPIAVALNGIGIAMIHRIDVGAPNARGAPFTTKHMIMAAAGIVGLAILIILLRRHQKLRAYTYTAMVASVVLLILPTFFTPINGARIWVQLFGFSFQPAEITKIALTVFFAGYLVTNRDQLALAGPKFLGLRLPRGRDLGPLVIVWFISIGVLVLQRDLGTSLLIFGLFVAMLYIATERSSWVIIALLLFTSGAFIAWTQFGHVQKRVNAWLNTLDVELIDKVGGSGQIAQGLFGLAKGGLLGTGIGQGHPYKVPYSNSDLIYASLGEELGLVGLFAILMLIMILVERAFRTAIGVRDGFGKLLAAGLGFVFCLQVFVVVGGITRVIPLTGLTLPFLAHGGSSLIANWAVIALILRVSDAARRPTPPPGPSLIPDDAATTALDFSSLPNAQSTARGESSS